MKKKLNIQYICKKYQNLPKKKQINNWVKTIFNFFKKSIELTIRIVEIKEIKDLNIKYKKKNKPTNILSFYLGPINDNFLIKNHIGDLVLCHKIIEKEAFIQKKKINAHYAHMIIHGCLHIFGYHHLTQYEYKKMKNLEIKIMKKINYHNPYQLK
ncbi:MAG: rRNA maturation RNase YbeY [Arsenophonus sp.]|nr:MAG: rRNA maturation RNase YbeY [Arsenophonus sp.]